MVAHQQAAAKIVGAHPAVKTFSSSIGSGQGGTSNTGRVYVALKPRGERAGAQQVVTELRAQLARVPGLRSFPQVPPVAAFLTGALANIVGTFALNSPSLSGRRTRLFIGLETFSSPS